MSLANAALSLGSVLIPLEGLLLGAAVILVGYLLSRLVREGLDKLFRARDRAVLLASLQFFHGRRLDLSRPGDLSGVESGLSQRAILRVPGGLGIVSVAVGIAASKCSVISSLGS